MLTLPWKETAPNIGKFEAYKGLLVLRLNLRSLMSNIVKIGSVPRVTISAAIKITKLTIRLRIPKFQYRDTV